MDHQDWNQVVFSKKKPNPVKIGSSRTQEQSDIERLENDEPVKRNTEKLKEFAEMVRNFRSSRQMSQKDLATMVNVKSDVIQQIEAGKLLPDANTVNKIKRRLR
jgi:ribosome-binding protein aMBF1 (putative translation factor)